MVGVGVPERKSEGGSRVGCRESLPFDEGKALARPTGTATPWLRSGSTVRLASADASPSYPPLTFAFHDKATIPAGMVRKILVRDIGLDEEEARKLL